MHPTILVQRQAKAIERIIERATALAAVLDLDPALIEALKPKGSKDLRVLEMMRLEALANLFDQLAAESGVTDTVTVETPSDEGTVGPTGLPAPTLDEQAESPAAETEAEPPAEVESAAAAIEETETSKKSTRKSTNKKAGRKRS